MVEVSPKAGGWRWAGEEDGAHCTFSVCPFWGSSGFAAQLQSSLLLEFDVSPLSTEIFLTFTVAEEGMEIFVEAVTGSERS